MSQFQAASSQRLQSAEVKFALDGVSLPPAQAKLPTDWLCHTVSVCYYSTDFLHSKTRLDHWPNQQVPPQSKARADWTFLFINQSNIKLL